MGEPPSEFGQQLRSLREAQGLSVRALAELVGVSKVTVWKWEKGDSLPRARLIMPLAKALDVPPLRLHPPFTDAEDSLEQPQSEAQERSDFKAQGPAEALTDVVARAKQMIAEASGVSPKNITISIEY